MEAVIKVRVDDRFANKQKLAMLGLRIAYNDEPTFENYHLEIPQAFTLTNLRILKKNILYLQACGAYVPLAMIKKQLKSVLREAEEIAKMEKTCEKKNRAVHSTAGLDSQSRHIAETATQWRRDNKV